MARMGRPPSDEYLVAERERDIYGISAYVFKAWNAQRYAANRRCIPFRFGLFAWDQWWKRELIILGPDARRGRRKGQYLMARYGDAGAYEHGNVYAATASQNANDIPEDVRAMMQVRIAATLARSGRRRGDHLTLGNQHPRAKAVDTPLGRYASIRLASEAHDISERTGRYRVKHGVWTLA